MTTWKPQSSKILTLIFSICIDLLNILGCLMTIRVLSCPPVFSLLPDICGLPQQFPTYCDTRTWFQWVNSTLLKFNGGKLHTYLIHYWASLVAQLVKSPLAMQETWVWSLGWEDSLEKRKATHSSILTWRIPWTVAKSWTRLSDFPLKWKGNIIKC